MGMRVVSGGSKDKPPGQGGLGESWLLVFATSHTEKTPVAAPSRKLLAIPVISGGETEHFKSGLLTLIESFIKYNGHINNCFEDTIT